MNEPTSLEMKCAEFEEILRLVCHHLELPQSESGPADDIRLYDGALEALDHYARDADRDLAENRRLRFKAEADCERILKALAPVLAAASKLPDPRDISEGSSSWMRMTEEFSASLAKVDHAVFRSIYELARNIGVSEKGGSA